MTRVRRGSLLIEMITSMTSGSVILLLAIGLIHQSMHWSTRTQARTDQYRTLEHIARQWRRDAHSSSSITLVSDDEIVFHRALGPNVIYRISGSRVIRMESASDANDQGPFHRDEYTLSDQNEINIEQLNAPKRARLQVRRAAPGGDFYRLELNVDGVIDRWSSLGGGS